MRRVFDERQLPKGSMKNRVWVAHNRYGGDHGYRDHDRSGRPRDIPRSRTVQLHTLDGVPTATIDRTPERLVYSTSTPEVRVEPQSTAVPATILPTTRRRPRHSPHRAAVAIVSAMMAIANMSKY